MKGFFLQVCLGATPSIKCDLQVEADQGKHCQLSFSLARYITYKAALGEMMLLRKIKRNKDNIFSFPIISPPSFGHFRTFSGDVGTIYSSENCSLNINVDNHMR